MVEKLKQLSKDKNAKVLYLLVYYDEDNCPSEWGGDSIIVPELSILTTDIYEGDLGNIYKITTEPFLDIKIYVGEDDAGKHKWEDIIIFKDIYTNKEIHETMKDYHRM